MLDIAELTFTAFAGARRIDSGPLPAVAASVKRAIDAGETGEILIFKDFERPRDRDRFSRLVAGC